jgi:hypothetical protein
VKYCIKKIKSLEQILVVRVRQRLIKGYFIFCQTKFKKNTIEFIISLRTEFYFTGFLRNIFIYNLINRVKWGITEQGTKPNIF